MKSTLLTLVITAIGFHALAQLEHEMTPYVPETDPLVMQQLEKWQELKFGLLMHWGPYSQWGIVESWSICAEDEGWCRRSNENYTDYKKEYENLQTTFDPVHFDPEKWARAASNAGMKYVVFTTKHHDGFCMFDSRYTDYKITDTKTPFHSHPKANITREVFDAFRAEGLWAGAYFSKPDWHSEYYWWPNFATPDRNVNYSVNSYPERWENFVQFTHNQVMELMTDYGKVDILWLDGGWVRKRTIEEIRGGYGSMNPDKPSRLQNQDIRMDELAAKARRKQPGLIVVDRAVYGKNQNYLTPENRVPRKALDYPWESCIISGGGWSWTSDASYMSGREAIHMLVDIVAKGGNLLYNIAPGPDGRWDEGAYKLLEEMGEWIGVNGDAIYGTRAIAPYKEGNVCFTKKGEETLFMIYLQKEGEAMPPTVRLETIDIPKGARIEMLGKDGRLKWKSEKEGITVTIPEKFRNNPPSDLAWTLKVTW
ncbi:MAG: alpha-L-fucosidase [Bacteroidota bacterium]